MSKRLVALALLAACTCPPKVADTTPTEPTPEPVVATPPDAGPGDQLVVVPEPRLRGAACTPGEDSPRGDCAEGLICLPAPGGYCVSPCGAGAPACPADGACLDSSRGGEWCAKRCESDADCRAAEGYACDPTWKACMLPGAVAPRAPVCDATAPLPRKRFGKVDALSTPAGPGAYHFEPASALAADGTLVTAYIAGQQGLGGANGLGVARVGADGALDLDHPFASDRENHFDPWMAADRAGNLVLVWLGFDGGRAPEKRMQIGLARSADAGKTWSTAVPAHDATVDCPDEAPGCLDKPMVVVGPDKKDRKKDVLWVFYASAVTEALKVTRSTDGGKTFAPSVAVMEGGYGDAEAGADGDLHVVATNGSPARGAFGGPENKIEYALSTDGGATFSRPVPVSAAGESIPFYFSNPQVVPDARRKIVYVVYPSGTPDGRWDVTLAASKDGGKTWTRTKVNDDAHCASHLTPTAALDPASGKVHVVWTENRGNVGQVAWALCDAGGAKCGANEAVSDKPFASYAFVRHSTRWLGEYYSLVVDARRKRLHVVWTQTVDEGGQPIARIFHAAGKL